MRILHVITSLNMGGAEKLMVDLLPLFRKESADVDLCVYNGSKTPFYNQLDQCGINIISLGEKTDYYNPWHIFQLVRLMRKYDIVHTHNTPCQLFSAIASFFCKCKLITTEHNTTNRRRNYRLLSYVDKWMYSRYCQIICISDKTEEKLRSFIGHSSTKISTIYNGINVDCYKYAVSSESFDHSRFIITMVAAFREQKDQDTLVKSMRLLDSTKYELLLVGDGERRNVVENLTKELSLTNVRFLGIRNDIPSILKSSDVVVMSSHWEGFGLAAVEGMAAGKPVVASNVDGLSQVVEGAGVLFPEGDEKALASEIQKLADNEEYYDKVAQKCSKRAEDFDISKMVQGYINVYNEIDAKK